MTTTVKNPTSLPKEVAILLADGKQTSVFIQPNSKVDLPPGASVRPSVLERDPSLKVINT